MYTIVEFRALALVMLITTTAFTFYILKINVSLGNELKSRTLIMLPPKTQGNSDKKLFH